MNRTRRGERSIGILAPCTYKTKRPRAALETDGTSIDDQADSDQDAEEAERGSGRRVLRGFRVAHVFDINQTDGTGVQRPERPKLLEGEAPAGLWDTLARQVAGAGYTLARAEIASGANGVTNFATRTVAVAPRLSAAQAAKTLAHD
jgi:hypothetical protein